MISLMREFQYNQFICNIVLFHIFAKDCRKLVLRNIWGNYSLDFLLCCSIYACYVDFHYLYLKTWIELFLWFHGPRGIQHKHELDCLE